MQQLCTLVVWCIFNPYTLYCTFGYITLHTKDGLHSLARGFCVSRKGGIGRGGWGLNMHMVVARLGCERTMVGTRWVTSHPDCIDRLSKHYSQLVEGWFLARKAALAMSGCMNTASVDYCMLVNEWAWLRSQVSLLVLELDTGSVLESELGQKWRYGALKHVYAESSFKWKKFRG